ncbi:MAG: hypothetical protein ACTHMD_03445 [Flavisolibacter sp.]
MRTILILLLFALMMSGCSTSKQGCPGTTYQGPKYKASKFSWY